MKLQPLAAYRVPDYPTQEIVRHHPELLRALPRRWHHNRLVLATLAGLLGLMEQSTVSAEDQPTLRVAPIFLHGKGQASFGGIASSRVDFLTEDEARDVIEEEAKKAGVEFPERRHPLNGVELPITDKYAFLAKRDPNKGTPANATKKTSQNGVLILTGWNIGKKVGYKFVARSDFNAWETKEIRGMCTVSEFDLLDAANRLQTGLTKVKEPGAVGVFYDPAASQANGIASPERPKLLDAPPKNGKALSQEEKKDREEIQKRYNADFDRYLDERFYSSKKASAEELRLQVRDFLAWLKAQGVM